MPDLPLGMDETADPGIEVSSGEAADRLAADLNERFGAGIGKADRVFSTFVEISANKKK